MIKLKYPTRFIGISSYFHDGQYEKELGKVHNGIDLYRDVVADIPIHSAGDGTVILVRDNDNTKQSWGNLVKIDHGNNVYTLYGHLKNGAKVVKGQKVKEGDIIGIMGCTGYCVPEGSIHCHYEVYIGGASTKYRVNPQDYTYADKVNYRFSINEKNKKNIKFIEDIVEITPIVLKDTSKDQLEVLLKDINVRTNAGVNSSTLGYCPKGIYNYYEVKENVDYTWYRIADNQWIAQNKANTYLKIMPKEIIEEPVEEPKEDIMKIEELEKKIAELEDKIKIDEEVIFELRKELNEYDNMKKYIAPENGIYKITLNEGDKIYLK